MKATLRSVSLLYIILLTYAPLPGQTTSQKIEGPCNVSVAGNNNTVTLTCKEIDDALAKRIKILLTRVDRHEVDTSAILTKLDELLRLGENARTSGTISEADSQPWPTFLLGGIEFVYVGDGESPLLLNGQPLLTLTPSAVNFKPLVSISIKDEKGNLLAEMKNNEWSHQARPAIYDRNYTDKVLEIRDARGEVALQVVNLGRFVYVAGIFQCSDGTARLITPTPDGGTIMERVSAGTSQMHIPALCEYPSETHLGDCPRMPSVVLPKEDQGGHLISGPLDICGILSQPVVRP